ncbi:MAG: RICIN domain-containing protein [Acidobacteriota bacterium]
MSRTSILRAASAVLFLCGAAAAHAQGPSGQLVGLGDKCVDVFQSGTDAGTPVVLWECTGNPNQQWAFDEIRNVPIDQFFLYEIVGLGGQCLQPGAVGDSGFVELEMGPCGTTNSEWGTSSLTADFRLTHESTQLCLDVLGSNTANGTPMILFECRDQANQRFRLLGNSDLPAYFVPFVETDLFDGLTTLFAVRNPSADTSVTVRLAYYATDRGPGQPTASQDRVLAPRGVQTVDVRNVPGLGVFSGWVGITSIDPTTGLPLSEQDLYGDFFRVNDAGNAASGDRLVSAADVQCGEWHSRFFNGGVFSGGTRFQIFVPELPEGATQWSLRGRVYDEQGNFVDSFTTVSTLNVTTVVPSFLAQPFGAIEWEFLDGAQGHISAVMTALGRFSVGLETECRD